MRNDRPLTPEAELRLVRVIWFAMVSTLAIYGAILMTLSRVWESAERSPAEVDRVADVPCGARSALVRRWVDGCPVRVLELVGDGHSVSLPSQAGTERLGGD